MVTLEIFTLVCIYLGVVFFRYFSEQAQLDKKHDYLHLSKAYFWLGLMGSVMFIIVAIITLILNTEIYIVYIFLVVAIVFAMLLLGYYGYRVYYDDEKILYRSFFGRYKIIHYKYILKW